MNDLDPVRWLNHEDSACREERLGRLKWLAALMPKSGRLAFHGGLLTKYLFEEARYCFVYGQFLGTIMLGTAFIEHTLAALFYQTGRSDLERAGFYVLLREAVAQGWLHHEDFEALERVRSLRNPISHFRRPLDEGTVEFRAVTTEVVPYSVVEEDARHVLQAVFRLYGTNLAGWLRA